MAGRIHAVVDGEVAADQVRTHGCVLAGKEIRFIRGVRLVLAIIDASNASIPSPGTV